MKSPRLVWIAAALLCWAALMTRTARAGGISSVWSDLWRTPDQQGQALLDAGKPAAAAARFDDPRRRAYADLEAGRFPQAAKLLAQFTDPRSEYNRGNALAESGRLPAALAAYDAALKQAPADEDIRHNRDLVERELRRRQSASSSSGNGRQGARGAGSGGQGRQPSASGPHRGSGSQQQSGSRGSQAGTGRSGSSGPQAASPQAGSPGSAGSKDSAGQARRDARFAAGLERAQGQRGAPHGTSQAQGSKQSGTSNAGRKGAGKAPDTGERLAGGTETPRQKPETEQQLALEQWLRQIPDSPAGLLRRKFLIEHMMKQQGGGPVESGP